MCTAVSSPTVQYGYLLLWDLSLWLSCTFIHTLPTYRPITKKALKPILREYDSHDPSLPDQINLVSVPRCCGRSPVLLVRLLSNK